MNAPAPPNETERLEALRSYALLDTPFEESLDQITGLATELFRVPIALISLVDADRIWFKSRQGLEAQQVAREAGLCASAIHSPDVYCIEDALADPRSRDNSLVTGEMGLRFYAGAPLRTREGHAIGTLCIIDRQPRDLTPADRTILAKLGLL